MLIKLNYTHDTKEKLVMDEEGTRLLKDGKIRGGGDCRNINPIDCEIKCPRCANHNASPSRKYNLKCY